MHICHRFLAWPLTRIFARSSSSACMTGGFWTCRRPLLYSFCLRKERKLESSLGRSSDFDLQFEKNISIRSSPECRQGKKRRYWQRSQEHCSCLHSYMYEHKSANVRITHAPYLHTYAHTYHTSSCPKQIFCFSIPWWWEKRVEMNWHDSKDEVHLGICKWPWKQQKKMLEVERRVPTKIQLHQQKKIHPKIKINPLEQAARKR